MKPARRRFWNPFSLLLNRPFLAASLLLHALLLAGLWALGPYQVSTQRQVQDQARIERTLREAQREQVRRQLARMEKLERETGASTAGSPPLPQDPVARAQALAERIEAQERKLRARELARLLQISEPEARVRLQAEAAKRPPAPLPAQPADAVAQLERRARDAVQRMQDSARRQQEGSTLAQRSTSPPARSSADAQRSASGKSAGGSSDTQADRKANGQSGGASGTQSAGKSGSQGAGGNAANGEATPGGGGGGQAAGSQISPNSIGGVGEPARTYTAAAAPPPLTDRARMRFAEARTFGPGAAYANRVYLDRWYVLGPFDARSSAVMSESHPAEVLVDLDAVYRGKGGQLVSWQAQQSPTYPFVPEPVAPDALYYAYTEVRVDQDTEVWLDIGADDDTKLWLNDQLVWTSGNETKLWYQRPWYVLNDEMSHYGLVEGRVLVRLKAGRNTLLLKLYNGIDLMFFSVVIAR
ncbi:hypothetical protein [Piscinibacterium candidicorallinum]|uniref:PA14 domain-containing protein n=1 Tax=Piscinibacterium candidicorallinum TaxID=1793872 RepID=A0ABV7H208_9BURK